MSGSDHYHTSLTEFSISSNSGHEAPASRRDFWQDTPHQHHHIFKQQQEEEQCQLLTDGLPQKSTLSTAFAPSARRSTCNNSNALTIDKLDIQNLALYGREEQLALLHQALDRLLPCSTITTTTTFSTLADAVRSKQQHHRELVWIHGLSGTGKSRLAHSIARKVRQQKGLYGRGKFDKRQGVPYAGLAQACCEICAQVAEHDDATASSTTTAAASKSFLEQLNDKIGTEKDVLMPFIPALAEIMDPSESNNQMHQSDDDNDNDGSNAQRILLSATEDGKKRFQFALVRFLQVLLEQFSGPLVLVLDDLTWADSPTMELIEVLLSEHTLDRLMIVGIYRSDEVEENHSLLKVIANLNALQATSTTKSLGITDLKVDNLELSSVKDILADLLRLDVEHEEFNHLALVCLQRTHGNVFFLLQFLAHLYEQKLLTFQLGSLVWTFNVETIRAQVAPTLNVVDVLKAKLMHLPVSYNRILQVAAFLGPTFKENVLSTLLAKMETTTNGKVHDEESEMDTKSSLASLVTDGYLTGIRTNDDITYKWTHDKIQEAAYALVPNDERGQLARDLGETLLTELSEKDLDPALFVVVNLLNSGYGYSGENETHSKKRHSEVDSERMIRLNLQAARKALLLSAFESATQYASIGRTILGDDCWNIEPSLSFQVYSVSARAEMLIGQTEKSEELCNAIICQREIDIEEKLDVYATLVDTILARGKNARAVELLLDVLSKFHCHFPKNMALVIASLLKDLFLAKKKAKFIDVRKMKPMNDLIRSELMRLLDKLSACMYIAKDNRLPLVIFRSFNWTLQYGYNNYSPVAFATAGMMISGILGDLNCGSTYGEKALLLMEQTEVRVSAARTMFCVYPAVFPWTKPVRTLLSPVMQAYQSGLRFGDTETAVNAIGYWMVLKFISGVDLDTVESDLATYAQQMRVLGKDKYASYYSIKRQAISNLMGATNVEYPTRLQGDIFTVEAEALLRDDVFHEVSIESWEGLLLFYFGHHTAHADSTLKNGHDYLEKVHFCSAEIWWDTLLRGISCFEAARQTRKRKYLKMGRKLRSKVKKWIARGNPNLAHYEAILDAEHYVSCNKTTEAIASYQNGLLYAARGGHQPEAAIASERLGAYYMTLGETEHATYRLSESMRYFCAWGALAVVHDREKRYATNLLVRVEQPMEEHSTISSLTGGPSQPFR